jgi:ribA/ribD-fused uncharacterized protein
MNSTYSTNPEVNTELSEVAKQLFEVTALYNGLIKTIGAFNSLIPTDNYTKTLKDVVANGVTEKDYNDFNDKFFYNRKYKFFKYAGYSLDTLKAIDKNNRYNYFISNKNVVSSQDMDKEISENVSPVNIYAGTGENAELSNFAVRPFTIAGDEYQSVEQYFQYQKWNYLKEDVTESEFKEDQKVADSIMNTSNGATLKSLGRKFKNLDIQSWDKNASKEMKTALIASFEQNPDALAKLLNTGNAELTHTQDKGKWGKEFPKLLMEVREELKGPSDKDLGLDNLNLSQDDFKCE